MKITDKFRRNRKQLRESFVECGFYTAWDGGKFNETPFEIHFDGPSNKTADKQGQQAVIMSEAEARVLLHELTRLLDVYGKSNARTYTECGSSAN